MNYTIGDKVRRKAEYAEIFYDCMRRNNVKCTIFTVGHIEKVTDEYVTTFLEECPEDINGWDYNKFEKVTYNIGDFNDFI